VIFSTIGAADLMDPLSCDEFPYEAGDRGPVREAISHISRRSPQTTA